MKVAYERRQSHVQDRVVQADHQQRQAQDPEDPPPPPVAFGVLHAEQIPFSKTAPSPFTDVLDGLQGFGTRPYRYLCPGCRGFRNRGNHQHMKSPVTSTASTATW